MFIEYFIQIWDIDLFFSVIVPWLFLFSGFRIFSDNLSYFCCLYILYICPLVETQKTYIMPRSLFGQLIKNALREEINFPSNLQLNDNYPLSARFSLIWFGFFV